MTGDEEPPTLGAWDLVGLGGLNLACLVVGLGIGWFVDDASGQAPVFTLVGLAVGITVGIVVSWIRIRRFLQT
ncbi:MAG TPA: hypothetical protein VH419_04475 [Nocardioidaceae bacterium]|jgi:F0F1-type ATP synthase assembly protein I